jgi:outer membrane receptor protein involved in Fe transport
VAGVVNVILKRDFEGVELSGRTLISDRGDGAENDLSATFGRDFARGRIMGGLEWSRRDGIDKGARAFSAQAPNISAFFPLGSYTTGANPPSQAAVDAVFARYGVAPGAVPRRGSNTGFGFNADGTLFGPGNQGTPVDVQNYRGPPDEVVTAFFPDVYGFNFAPDQKLILPLERWSGALFGDVAVTDHLKLFGQALYARYTTSTALAPTTAPTDPNPLYPGQNLLVFTIPVTNPFIPPDLRQLLASRTGDTLPLAGSGPNEEFGYRFRAVALGPRASLNQADALNLLGGIDVDLGRGWSGQAYASYGRYGRQQRQQGLLATRRFEQLLDSPTGGTEFCAGGLNPFGAGINAACADFLKVGVQYRVQIEQTNVVASASGRLFDLPAGPALAAVGAEFRAVRYAFTPPSGIGPGEVAGFTLQNPLSGSVRFADLFAEARLPLLAGRRFAEDLDLTLGYRRSDERVTGGADAYKAELSWTPVHPLRLRGAYQRAVRAPDIFERFEVASRTLAFGSDPCALSSAARTPQVLALCRQEALQLGLPASSADSFDDPGQQVATTTRGNPDVKSEQATTLTLGAVLRPTWTSAWFGAPHASIDWYDIRIKGAIGYLDAQVVLNGCYNLLGGTNPGYDPANPFCRSLQRSNIDFRIFNLETPETNQVFVEASGVDAALAFRTDLAAISGRKWLGVLDTSLALTWLGKYEQQASSAQPAYDFAGTIDGYTVAYGALPRWRGTLDLVWTSGPVSVSTEVRYIDAMDHRLQRIFPDNNFSVGTAEAWYADLSARWAVRPGVDLIAGVVNLFDRQPQTYTPPTDGGTDPSTYDVVGRRYWLALRARF